MPLRMSRRTTARPACFACDTEPSSAGFQPAWPLLLALPRRPTRRHRPPRRCAFFLSKCTACASSYRAAAALPMAVLRRPWRWCAATGTRRQEALSTPSSAMARWISAAATADACLGRCRLGWRRSSVGAARAAFDGFAPRLAPFLACLWPCRWRPKATTGERCSRPS